MIRKLLRRVSAGLLSGVMIASAAVSPVSAAVVDKENPNNYDNFAEALQLALCFYDANKCGDEVADDGYYTWRGNCHVKDGMIPLVPMQSLGGGKANEDSGKGDGGASAAEGLYVGTNMSQEFIDANKKYLDPEAGTMPVTTSSSVCRAATLPLPWAGAIMSSGNLTLKPACRNTWRMSCAGSTTTS